MANTIINRLRTAWNIFQNKEAIEVIAEEDGVQVYGYRTTGSAPYRHRMRLGNEQSIVNAVYSRCAIDVSTIKFRHVRVDQNGSFIEEIDSGINNCLSLSANIDQAHTAFIQDIVASMFDEGCVAVVPVDTTIDITNNVFDILSMRTGKVTEWSPQAVKINVYNDITGRPEDIVMPKNKVSIVENPFYSIMNQTNSTLQRLIRKLNLLDVIDEQSGSGKLDLIIQLPYTIKGDVRKKQAEDRRIAMEEQLANSKYGVAYADAVEKIIQLNRPAENNLLSQVEYLTRMLYGQLGISEKILEGSATEEEYLNYYNRTIEPISSAIANEMKRKFLSQTAIAQGQSIIHFRNVFGVITAASLAELSDKLTRNEILTGNEFRGAIGYRPSNDPRANELKNKNLNDPNSEGAKVPANEEIMSNKGVQ